MFVKHQFYLKIKLLLLCIIYICSHKLDLDRSTDTFEGRNLNSRADTFVEWSYESVYFQTSVSKIKNNWIALLQGRGGEILFVIGYYFNMQFFFLYGISQGYQQTRARPIFVNRFEPIPISTVSQIYNLVDTD